MRRFKGPLGLLVAALAFGALSAPTAGAASILFRCGPDVCRMDPDGSDRRALTRDGRPGGPSYSWLSAIRSGARLAVVRAGYAQLLDGRGRRLGRALRRSGSVVVAQVSPDGRRVATLELVGELSRAPTVDPFGRWLVGFQPYLFTAAANGSGKRTVARAVASTAWFGRRLLRSTKSATPPFAYGVCLLPRASDFRCARSLARDPRHHLLYPAPSPDGRLIAVTRARIGARRLTGPIVLYDTTTGRGTRTLTTGPNDALPTWSPDGRRIAFNRGRSIYVASVTGRRQSERRIARQAVQPIWVTGR